MPLESLGTRNRSTRPSERGGAARLDHHLRHRAPEVARGEHGGKARGACRGQHVVGACDVVAEGGGAVRADEHATGADHPCGELLGATADELQVLRREGVRDLERPQRVICLDEQQRRSRARRLLGVTLLQLLCQRVGDSRSGCQRGDDAALPVLALREHVQRRPLHGVLGAVLAEDEQQVAGSGEAVDADDLVSNRLAEFVFDRHERRRHQLAGVGCERIEER